MRVVCMLFICLLTLTLALDLLTGALGNDHPGDTLQRTGRFTSGLACGGEK